MFISSSSSSVRSFVFAIIVSSVLILLSGGYGGTFSITAAATAWSLPPTFVVDLSVEPRNRWNGAVDLILSRHSYNDSFAAFFVNFQKDQLDAMSAVDKAAIVASVMQNFPTHYEEMAGIADQFNSVPDARGVVTRDFLALWMWFHELSHAPSSTSSFKNKKKNKECTGILVLPADRSLPIFHARNLDQDYHTARNATLHVQFKKTSVYGDTVLFEGTGFYWTSTGLVTMQQSNGFTFEENWMFETVEMKDIVHCIVSLNATPQVIQFREFLMRHLPPPPPHTTTIPAATPQQPLLMKTTTSSSSSTLFEDVLQFFHHDRVFAAGQYVIFSAMGRKGGVLSLSFDTNKNKMEILEDPTTSVAVTPTKNLAKEGEWFLVQTNYNRSLPDPSDDPRRSVAIKALKDLGREVGATSMGAWLALTQPGVSVSDTEYSCLMSATRIPGTPQFNCVIRDFSGNSVSATSPPTKP